MSAQPDLPSIPSLLPLHQNPILRLREKPVNRNEGFADSANIEFQEHWAILDGDEPVGDVFRMAHRPPPTTSQRTKCWPGSTLVAQVSYAPTVPTALPSMTIVERQPDPENALVPETTIMGSLPEIAGV
jgi:hypothetical protein